jgi:hypothetical protein
MSLDMLCPVCNTRFTAVDPKPPKPEVKRLTDARNTLDNAFGDVRKLSFIGVEYASVCPWSCDGSWLLLVHQSYFGLYDVNGKYVEDLPFDINASSRPRWDRTNADLIYYQAFNQLRSYNVREKTSMGLPRSARVVATFSEYTSIDSMGEADFEGDCLPLCGTKADGTREIFVYSLSRGKGKAIIVDDPFDSLYVTSKGNLTATWNANGLGRFHGVELYDAEMDFIRQLTDAGGHMCFANDSDGSEILLWTNSNSSFTHVPQQSIVKVRVSDGWQTGLMMVDWKTLAIDIGANAGWFCLSVYGGPNSNGKPYAGEILMVNIATGEIVKVCDHGSSAKDYTAQPKAAVSRDGKKIVFCSDMGDSTPDYCDVYMVKL